MNQIQGKVSPPGQKSASISGNIYPTGGRYEPESGQDFTPQKMASPESQAKKPTLEIVNVFKTFGSSLFFLYLCQQKNTKT